MVVYVQFPQKFTWASYVSIVCSSLFLLHTLISRAITCVVLAHALIDSLPPGCAHDGSANY